MKGPATMSDWQDVVMAQLGQRHQKKARGPAPYPGSFRRDLIPLHFHCAREFIGFIDKAARKRDVNRSSYVRRAIAVAIAHDLGMNIRDLLYHSPAIGAFGKHQYYRGHRDTAEGIEQWCPHPGCEGEHL